MKHSDWLPIPSTMPVSNQSECFISVQYSYTTLKIVYDIDSSFNNWKIVGTKMDGSSVDPMSFDHLVVQS